MGNFLGSDALAAVSSSGSLTFLLVGFFQGLAMGAGVIIARYFGARQKKELHRAIHTTVAFGILCGILLTAGGVVPVSYTHLDVYKRQVLMQSCLQLVSARMLA